MYVNIYYTENPCIHVHGEKVRIWQISKITSKAQYPTTAYRHTPYPKINIVLRTPTTFDMPIKQLLSLSRYLAPS